MTCFLRLQAFAPDYILFRRTWSNYCPFLYLNVWKFFKEYLSFIKSGARKIHNLDWPHNKFILVFHLFYFEKIDASNI
ncbi:uncharacterized protein TOL2_C25440 [Desulfobacula toluolica Tol2]|uniref:Uncharacterized protein n=1 Tax=Desulfobacula toluolica (strain DSM 7467 / Tol2) TaxID=651182 RepID=K0NL61_DESTT|nr:uncharacterized protein TOL2_C25440 [Desulfobacula toluolica Tol2]